MFRPQSSSSGRQTLARKLLARTERSTRKLRSQDSVPFCGIEISKRVVKNHRYLRDHGLPHSPAAANVNILPPSLLGGRNLGSLALVALLMGLI